MKKEDITLVTGVDIGDQYSEICLLDAEGEVVEMTRIRTNQKGIQLYFDGRNKIKVALEVGTHSPWVSRLIASMGHEVLVANSYKLRMIYANDRKSDRVDAQTLARVARMDPELLFPIKHRGEGSQTALAVVRARDVLVKVRAKLVNHVRGAVKSFGHRLPVCSTESFHKHSDKIPDELKPALMQVMQEIERLTLAIKNDDRQIERICQEKYPEALALQQVNGVGPVTSLAYVLTLEDPSRFKSCRDVGAYLGLVPRRDQTGENERQLGISKRGDPYLRSLLVGCAHYILGPFGPDTDLRRWGLKLAERGGKNGKQRALVAVARKLSVLLYRLWKSGELYEPLRQGGKAMSRRVTVSS